jgi:SPP1 family predicted phage head-tail adaptor
MDCKTKAKPLSSRVLHTVDVEQQATTRDSHGQPSTTWTTVKSAIRVAIEPLRANEFFAAQQYNSEVTTRIRAFQGDASGVTAAMRVNFGGRYFNIEGIIDQYLADNAGEVQWMSSEGANDG